MLVMCIKGLQEACYVSDVYQSGGLQEACYVSDVYQRFIGGMLCQ